MNRKQLSIAWAMAVLICAAIIFTPKVTTWKEGLLILKKDNGFLAPLVNWNLVSSFIAVIGLIGGLLIFTVRDKQK
jgi:hypothetical protein